MDTFDLFLFVPLLLFLDGLVGEDNDPVSFLYMKREFSYVLWGFSRI